MQGDQRSEDDQVAEVPGVAVEHAERDGYLPPTARALATTGGGATVFRFDLLETARLPLSLTDSRECDGPDVHPSGDFNKETGCARSTVSGPTLRRHFWQSALSFASPESAFPSTGSLPFMAVEARTPSTLVRSGARSSAG
jgi:hypothetical protein